MSFVGPMRVTTPCRKEKSNLWRADYATMGSGPTFKHFSYEGPSHSQACPPPGHPSYEGCDIPAMDGC